MFTSVKTIAAALTLVIAACAGADTETIRDLSYYPPDALAAADDYQRTRCRLDLRYPSARKYFPTLVWFHGGGLAGGEPPYEWKCRAEENRLLIATLTALGHPSASYLELPACDHGRCDFMSPGYVELFIKGRLPANGK